MKSMTGYGASEGRTAEAEFSITVKSVNGRFLEPRFHLPKEYFALEAKLKKEVASVFERGTIDIFVYRRGSANLNVRFNSKNAQLWVEAHRQLARTLKLPLNLNSLAERVSSLPQVFEARELTSISSQEKIKVLRAVRIALRQCLQERLREGRSLSRHLRTILNHLKNLVAEMEQLRASSNRELETKLYERLRKISKELAIDPTRFAEELVYYLDKSDIGEELARLNEHLQMCSKYILSRAAGGKKLDFYGQELLREVNTIGSKANHARLTELVVEAKGFIEAFKEQVQNVE